MTDQSIERLREEQPLRIAYIIGTFPSLTTTFIDREIIELRALGVDLQVLAVRCPTTRLSEEQRKLQQGVRYLLPVAWVTLLKGHLYFAASRSRAYFGTLLYLLSRPHPDTRSRVRTLLHFGEGAYAAYLLMDGRWDHLHAHFVDRAATIVLVVGRLLRVSYSVTAHANDIYVRPVLLPEKLGGASFVATCTNYNRQHIVGVGAGELSQKVKCIYHGLDIRHYQPGTHPKRPRPLLLAVGQLKEKKGFSYLLDACHLLRQRGYEFDCQIIGEGPLREKLEAQIREQRLEGIVTMIGALPHPEVIKRYQQASLFVLPCVLGADGDRDGIPNVILEAMAMELPVVSTNHSGIPEVVEDSVNGRLVPAANSRALADAVADLLDHPEQCQILGKRGRQVVADHFDVARNAARILNCFRSAISPTETIIESTNQGEPDVGTDAAA